MDALLEKAGLTGPYQVHHAPTLLAFDERAHQILVGAFSSAQIGRHFGGRFRPESPVWTEHGTGTLADFPHSESTILIAESGLDRPGGFYGLVDVVDRLLGPGGCPWDIEQTHQTLKKYLLEEAYELMQAIDDDDDSAMREELGDVLLQPLMHSQKKQLSAGWGIDTVAQGITDKLVRRHPHVFGDTQADDSAAVLRNWDAIKKQEKGGGADNAVSILDGVPRAMPALLLALEISKRAARAGFEWPDMEAVWGKFHEEEREVQEALAGGDKSKIADEFGDLLFTVVNLARWAKVDPEDALRQMVTRFRTRFEEMERHANKPLTELSPQEWDDLWNAAKQSPTSVTPSDG